MTGGSVLAVAKAGGHGFSKSPTDAVELEAGRGVVGDAHCGETVKHRSRVAVDPSQPNLRQVHLLQSELFGEVARHGFALAPGDLGENITTAGIDVLALSQGTRLKIGRNVVLEVTGLRNPCAQIDRFRPGLLAHVAVKSAGAIMRRAGIMSVVLASGTVRPGDEIQIAAPPGPHRPLEPV